MEQYEPGISQIHEGLLLLQKKVRDQKKTGSSSHGSISSRLEKLDLEVTKPQSQEEKNQRSKLMYQNRVFLSLIPNLSLVTLEEVLVKTQKI